MTVTEELGAWVSGLQLRDLPPEVRGSVQRHLLDALGTALAARRLGSADATRKVAQELGGPPEAVVVGGGPAIGAPACALATGALVHALDFDDTHAVGLVHASAVVVPAVLAVGQQVGATGSDVLVALAVGYEVMCRLAAAAPHGFHARGLHATSVVGPVAAAAAAGRLLDLGETTLVDAMGIAGSAAGGLLEFLDTNATTKQLHPGWAAANGIIAARLAAAGATGPSSVLEGRYGLYAALSARPASHRSVVAGLGETWETARMTIKPYPACQLLHATLDAALSTGVAGKDVVRVVAEVHPDAVGVVCEPRSRKLAPSTGYEAKFSLPWSTAAALIDGHVDVDTYELASLRRPEVARLAERVVVVEAAPSAVAAADAPGLVHIEMADGGHRDRRVAGSTGTAAAPTTDAAVRDKFRRNVGNCRTADAVARVVASLADLAQVAALVEETAR